MWYADTFTNPKRLIRRDGGQVLYPTAATGGELHRLGVQLGGWHIHWQMRCLRQKFQNSRTAENGGVVQRVAGELREVSALRDLCTMDSLSQIVLGAAVGEAVLGKKLATAPWSGALLREPCLTWMS